MQEIISNNKRIIKNIRFKPTEKFFEMIKNDPFFKEFILNIIYSRVTSLGTDSDSKKLRTDKAILSSDEGGLVYSPNNKKKRNYNHVDLLDSGEMFESMSLLIKKNSIIINANLKGSKKTNVFENFQLSYRSEKEFKDLVFSLTIEEIDDLNELLNKGLDVFLKNEFNYR